MWDLTEKGMITANYGQGHRSEKPQSDEGSIGQAE